jgi:hypothetical protein
LRRNNPLAPRRRINDASRELASYFNFDEPGDDSENGQFSYLDNCDEYARAPTPPQYEGNADSDDEDDNLRDRHRALLRELNLESDNDEDNVDRFLRHYDNTIGAIRERRTVPARRVTPGRFIELRRPSAGPEEGGRIKPLRTFFIKPGRNEAILTFDPPV